MMEDEKGCEGCIWEINPDQSECDNCIRLIDAPFNDYDDERYVVDNYENGY